ncbi:uncharacterized protein C3orf38 homolog isoform X2 [Triplophysa dalaica]|uniref:uncharacterized protein C3orf38 homolog isoform X2 n=1 Tax=Triplophysa dalaica TaxID=1582913 RepID=UPI0024DF9158|nr:uncharacterized protein C3orf38 homolog isoform X2 [Triplophysa dalaica]
MFAGSRLLPSILLRCVTVVPKPGRKERHAVGESSPPSGLAVPESSGSADEGRTPVAARSGGSGETEVHSAATVKTSVERRPLLPRPWVEVGWLSSKWERGGCRRPPEAGACVRPPRGRSRGRKCRVSHRLPEAGACVRPPKGEEQGTGNPPRLPDKGGATAGRQGADGRAVHRSPRATARHREGEYSGWLRNERQHVGEPDFFSPSLPSLFPVAPRAPVSVVSSRRCIPPTPPPPREGEGACTVAVVPPGL